MAFGRFPMLLHGWVADPQQSVDILDYQYIGALTVRETLEAVNTNVSDVETAVGGLVTDVGAIDTAVSALPDTTAITNAIMAKSIDGKTFEQCLKLVTAVLAGKCSVVGSTVTFRDMDDTANRVVATTDEDGQRTAVTLSA